MHYDGGFPEKGKPSLFTADLEKCYNNRKDNFSSMILILKGFSKTTAKTEQLKCDAANYIMHLIGDYDAIKKCSYSNATGEYNKVTDKLLNSEATEALNRIGVKAIFDEIITENENFKRVYDSKISSTPVIPKLSLVDIKKEIVNHLVSILKYIDSKANRNTIGFTETANKINEVIADYLKVHKAE